MIDLINIWSSEEIQKKFKTFKTHVNIYKNIAEDYNAPTSRKLKRTPAELYNKIRNLQATYRNVSLKSGN